MGLVELYLELKYKFIHFQERDKLLFKSVLTSFISKGVSFFVALISVPLTLKYLGSNDFAILSTIIATFSVVSYFDFGIGIGLQNVLPTYIAQDNKKKIIESISTVFVFLLVASIVILSIGLLAVKNFDFRIYFNLNELIDNATIGSTILTCIFIIGFGMPISIIQRIQNAYQKSYVNEMVTAICGILSLVFLLVVINLKLSLPYVLFALQGSLLVGIFFNFILSLYATKLIQINLSFIQFKTLKFMAKIGLKYFLLLMVSVGLFTVDNLFLMRYSLAENVTEYSIIFRFISLMNVPLIIFSNSLVYSYNDANARGDTVWIRSKLLNSFKIIILVSLIEGLVFLLFGEILINSWAGTSFEFPLKNSIILSLLLVFLNFNFFLSAIAVTTKYLNFTLIYFSLGVFVTIACKYALSSFLKDNYIIIILPTIFIMPVVFLMPIFYKIYKTEL